MAGGAVTGALSMAFGCALRAPHGGIFVVPLIGNAFRTCWPSPPELRSARPW